MHTCRGIENISLPNTIRNKRKSDNILLIDENIKDTGWCMKDGNLVFVLDSKEQLICNKHYANFQTPIIINNNDRICPKMLSNGGILYRKKDSHELWWKTDFITYNLTPNINSDLPERIYDQKVSVITDNFEFTGKKIGIRYNIYPIGIDFYVEDKSIMKIYDRHMEKGVIVSGKININPTDEEILKFNNYGIFKIGEVLRIGDKNTGLDIWDSYIKSENILANNAKIENIETEKIAFGNSFLIKKENDLYWVSDKEYKLNEQNIQSYDFSYINNVIAEKTETKINELLDINKFNGFIEETINNKMSEYAKLSDMSEYAKLSDMSEYAKLSDMSEYAKLSDMSEYAKLSDIPQVEPVTNINKETDIIMSDSPCCNIHKLKFKAGCNIKKGDVLCINEDYVYKTYGGRIDYLNNILIPELNSDSTSLKELNSSIFYSMNSSNSDSSNSDSSNSDSSNSNLVICNSYYSETDIFNIITIFSIDGVKLNEYNYTISHENNILFSKVIHYENETAYLLYYIKGEKKITLCKISGIFTFPFVRQILEIDINHECECIEAVYDKINNLLMIVGYTMNNFVVVLVNNGEILEIGTIDDSISNIIITESKKLNILIIPGGTALISYGYSKTIIMYGMYNMIITSGETVMDYQSNDCISMLYNKKNGIITTIDKTISNYTYIQNFELFGTSIHKLSSKLLIDTPEPLACSYNETYDCYLLAYKNVSIFYKYVYVEDKINIGMAFSGSDANKVSLISINDSFYIIGRMSGIMSVIYKFINQYNGNPAEYIGIADNDANLGEDVLITSKGERFYCETNNLWTGKKIYLINTYQDFPNNLGLSGNILIGKCLCKNIIFIC